MNFKFNLSVWLLLIIGLWTVSPQTLFSDESDKTENPFSGTWKLESDWGKGGDKGKGTYLLKIDSKFNGTINDLKTGDSSKLLGCKESDGKLSFSFFYSEKEEYKIRFDGRIEDKKIKGSFSVFGIEAKVAGSLLSDADVKELTEKSGFEKSASAFALYKSRKMTGSGGETIRYRLFVPTDYSPKKKYPIVLFHHGGGGAGDDNRRNLESACVHEWIKPEAQAKNPCFILVPQIPSKSKKGIKGTESLESAIEKMKLRIQTIHEILDSLEKEFSIDKDREYVTGLSFGGECTWLSLMEKPDRFAAAIPICAGDSLMGISNSERGKKFAKFPMWIFHGDADKVISVEASRKIVKALKESGGAPRYTEYSNVGHYCWDKAYRDQKVIDWLFSQSRK